MGNCTSVTVRNIEYIEYSIPLIDLIIIDKIMEKIATDDMNSYSKWLLFINQRPIRTNYTVDNYYISHVKKNDAVHEHVKKQCYKTHVNKFTIKDHISFFGAKHHCKVILNESQYQYYNNVCSKIQHNALNKY